MKNNKQDQKEPHQRSFLKILKKTFLTFFSMAPLIIGIIGLVGLLQILVTPSMLASVFQGNLFIDTLIGTVSGAFAAGNPLMSYLLGGELLEQGISLYAVTAFILSWVTLGLVHLPAEAEVFGGKFVVIRNILAFVFTMIISILTTSTMYLLS